MNVLYAAVQDTVRSRYGGPALPSAGSALPRVAGAFSPSVERVVDEVEWSVLRDMVPPGQPFHEVDLPLVLPGPGALPGPAAPGKRHVPAVVFGAL